MARTRWPPDWEPWPLAQARQHRDGTAGGCQRNLGPADRSNPKTTSGVSRIEGQAGPRPPTLRPHQAKPAEAGPEAQSTVSLPIIGARGPDICGLGSVRIACSVLAPLGGDDPPLFVSLSRWPGYGPVVRRSDVGVAA